MTDLERKQQREALEKDRGVKRAKNDKEKIEKKTKKSFKPMAFVITGSKFDQLYENFRLFFDPLSVKQVDGSVETPPRKRAKKENVEEKEEEKMETDFPGTISIYLANKRPVLAPDPFKMPSLPTSFEKPVKKAEKKPKEVEKKEEKEALAETESKHAETVEEKARTIFVSNLRIVNDIFIFYSGYFI